MNELREILSRLSLEAQAKEAIAQADDLPFLMTRYRGMVDAYEQAMAVVDLIATAQSTREMEVAP
jgi:hypothetical protein